MSTQIHVTNEKETSGQRLSYLFLPPSKVLNDKHGRMLGCMQFRLHHRRQTEGAEVSIVNLVYPS